jgi:AcrR family transcriptional regulator
MYNASVARLPLGRQQLLDAARAELLAGSGQADLASLVRRAGVTTGALYHHFGSRAGLLAAIYSEYYDGLIEAISDTRLPARGAWAERERLRLRHMAAYCLASPLSRILLDRSGWGPALAELEAAYTERLIDTSARNIRRGQQLGQVDPAVNPETAAAYIIGGLRYSIRRQLRTTPPPSADEATRELWQLVAATIGAPNSPPFHHG